MAEKNKRGFHTVEEPDMEEYERKLREHRVKVVRRTVILIVTVLAVSAGLWVFMALRHYENFDVGSSVDRADTEATKFADFGGNILKYSNEKFSSLAGFAQQYLFYYARENKLIG